MKRLQRDSVILALVEAMKSKGSWCGETHIQKATYFLQELLGVPLGFEYVLYKHGPYSFGLSDALAQMRADGLLSLTSQPYPYGPSLEPDANSQLLKRLHPRTLEKYGPHVGFLAERLGSKNVAELERLSTAMYVTRESSESRERDDRARRLSQLKPHIPIEDARAAVEEFDKLGDEVRSGVAA